MPDWPPSGLSNHGYPGFPGTGLRDASKDGVLRKAYPDGTQDVRVRVQPGDRKKRFEESWLVRRADVKLMLDYYDSVGESGTFTKYRLDPQSAADSYATDEVTVQFADRPTDERLDSDWWEVRCSFFEV